MRQSQDYGTHVSGKAGLKKGSAQDAKFGKLSKRARGSGGVISTTTIKVVSQRVELLASRSSPHVLPPAPLT